MELGGSAGGEAILIRGRATYGASVEGSEFKISLLRTPAYTGHPLGDRRVLPIDRYTPHMDLGTHLFEFRLTGGGRQDIIDRAERLTQLYCERPLCMSFFPSGEGEKPAAGLRLEGDGAVVLSAYKESECGGGDVARVFNPTGSVRSARLVAGDNSFEFSLRPFSFESFMIAGGQMRPVRADEVI